MGLAILLIEDDTAFAQRMVGFLSKEEHDVTHAPTGEEGVRLLQEKNPDLVLLDLMLPGIDGMQTLEQLKKLDESVAVIVMTAHSSVATAVEAMRLGALDYVSKPVDLEALSIKLEQTKDLLGMRSDLGYLMERERRGDDFESFIGGCQAMQEVYEKIKEVAKTDNTTVLVTGQSGTGKEVATRAIHSLSTRANRPLMQIDCTTIPLTLMESELFGHERGAFSGADRTKKGLLELADGGTLLLDEIGDMAIDLQAKLLRVLQERQFRRVGGTRNLRFDVRVIAATNQDLDRRAQEGIFRHDLLYRLKVFQIELPPLAARGNDVIDLAETFLRDFASQFRKPVRELSAEAHRALLDYEFPGNVRELRNIIEQAVILCKGESLGRDLLSIGKGEKSTPAGSAKQRSPGLSLESLGDEPLAAAERELIRQALDKSAGKKKRAAELLGISRFALQRKLDKLALESLETT